MFPGTVFLRGKKNFLVESAEARLLGVKDTEVHIPKNRLFSPVIEVFCQTAVSQCIIKSYYKK